MAWLFLQLARVLVVPYLSMGVCSLCQPLTGEWTFDWWCKEVIVLIVPAVWKTLFACGFLLLYS